MTENLTPGVYVVLPGGETAHWVPEEMNKATSHLGHALSKLVGFLQAQWPALNESEATLVAAALVASLPVFLQDNPELLQALSQDAGNIRARRRTN